MNTAYIPDFTAPAVSLPAPPTLSMYVDALRRSGLAVVPGSGGAYWVASQGIVRRLPTFHVGAPAESEVDRALRLTGAVIATYLRPPGDRCAANAWLYLCDSHDYAGSSPPPAMRRNIRRALGELIISPLATETLLAHGARAFCDTRRRAGLSDGTAHEFRHYFADALTRPGRAYLGAWRNGQLAAFISILHVDDWAEISTFSMTSMLRYRPNDALVYALLSHYLGSRRCRLVSYGVSSIQARSNAAGLHRFKRKVGFTTRRVHRAFEIHPTIRPLANQLTLTAAHWAASGVLRLRPRNPRLKKLGGMLACMRGETSMMRVAEGYRESPGRDALPVP